MCEHRFEIPYILLGAPISCPSCGKEVVPKMSTGTTYPDTAYQVTFADFELLLTNHRYRPSISRLLSRWFGYEIVANGESVSVRSEQGDEINLLWLHRRIQGDTVKQHELYQAAMALWR